MLISAESKWKVAELVILSGYSDFSAVVILLAVLGHNKMLKYRAMCIKDDLSSEKKILVTLATDSYKPKTNHSKTDY